MFGEWPVKLTKVAKLKILHALGYLITTEYTFDI